MPQRKVHPGGFKQLDDKQLERVKKLREQEVPWHEIVAMTGRGENHLRNLLRKKFPENHGKVSE